MLFRISVPSFLFVLLTVLKSVFYRKNFFTYKVHVNADTDTAFIPAKVMETLENNLRKLSNTEYGDPFLGKLLSELK